jgi:uncharacterized DUF497 family protein
MVGTERYFGIKVQRRRPFILIAEIPSGCWTAIFTKRGKKIRIISVRRARKNEKELFYAKK